MRRVAVQELPGNPDAGLTTIFLHAGTMKRRFKSTRNKHKPSADAAEILPGRYRVPDTGSGTEPGKAKTAMVAQAAVTAEPGRGCLYVVATPIGNLEDLSPRAQSILRNSGLILAEDTRHFKNLAIRFGIDSKVRSYHDHNEQAVADQIADVIQGGVDVALVSDAGTPTINDPGYRIINSCFAFGVAVRTVPGPCAFVAALSISGFETHRFQFEGYVPPKGQKRETFLRAMADAGCTAIAYETPHRILSTLEIIAQYSPRHHVCIARELTKVHEEVLRGPVEEIYQILKGRGQVKGEIVILIRGREYFEA